LGLHIGHRPFQTITRQRVLPQPACDDFSLRTSAGEIFREVDLTRPVRLIGFGVGRLVDHGAGQLSLFSEENRHADRREQLSRTVDTIRHKFGDGWSRSPSSNHGEAQAAECPLLGRHTGRRLA
jgi:hypothetical protein